MPQQTEEGEDTDTSGNENVEEKAMEGVTDYDEDKPENDKKEDHEEGGEGIADTTMAVKHEDNIENDDLAPVTTDDEYFSAEEDEGQEATEANEANEGEMRLWLGSIGSYNAPRGKIF